jgi:hypothetical protein
MADTSLSDRIRPRKVPNTFENFLKLRDEILETISQFLEMVLVFCVELEDDEKCTIKPDAIGGTHARLLVLSLCKIHAFYGYPTSTREEWKNGSGEIAIGKWLMLFYEPA